MSAVTPGNIKEIAAKQRNYSARILSQMIKIRSLSGGEEKMARLLEKEFRDHGADEVVIDGLGNVIARLGNKGPVIAFDGHLDTVDMGQRSLWERDPLSGEIVDGRIYGRGAVDQKGGLTAMLASFRILKELGADLPFTLFYMGTVQEEVCEGLSWRYIINEEKIVPDMVILTEPTGCGICRGQRGRMEMEIQIEGFSCHGSTPELGKNAIYKIAPMLTAIERLNKTLPVDPFLGKGSIAVTRVRSEAPSLNAVPDMAAIYVDRRLTGGETPEDAKNELTGLEEISSVMRNHGRLIIPAYEEPSWRGTTYPALKTYPAWTLDERHHLIEYAGRCHNRLFDTNPEIGKWNFSTNGVVTKGIYDIPTFGYGPGDERMAHAPNESVAIDDIIRCAEFYAYFPWIVVGR